MCQWGVNRKEPADGLFIEWGQTPTFFLTHQTGGGGENSPFQIAAKRTVDDRRKYQESIFGNTLVGM